MRSGKKQKAAHGLNMNVDNDTITKFVDYCLRPDNVQDVAHGRRQVDVDDGTSLYAPNGFEKATEPKCHMHSSKSSVTKCKKCLPELRCTMS